MKFSVLAVLASVFVVPGAAVPNRGAGQLMDNRDSNATVSAGPHRSGGAIRLGLGTQHVNVGNTPSGELYGKIYFALQQICFSGDRWCTGNAAHFAVKVSNDNQVEMLVVTVEGSEWHYNSIVYRLLIGAVAGAVERGTWSDHSCREVKTRWVEGITKSRHCNTVDYVSVEFPNGNFMKVRLISSKDKGNFDCAQILGYARSYVDTLIPEIQNVLGDNDIWMDEQCLW